MFLFLTINVNKTVSFFNNLDLKYKTYRYSVVVLKTSDYKKLKDVTDKKVGVYDDGSNESKKALEKLKSKVNVSIVSYDDTHKLADDLLSGVLDSFLIESSYLTILDENMIKDEQGFKSFIRVIYRFNVIVKTSNVLNDIDVTKESFNVYISGIDTFGEIGNVSRSDVNMIVTVNPKTRQILLTSIPRDFYVKLHGKSGYPDKLTHAGLYGVEMSMQTLEDLLNIDINYYVKVNFSSVVNIVDALNGVDVYSEYDFVSIDQYRYSKGYNNVSGDAALSFARERKAFAAGDRQRVKNQQALLAAIFHKATNKQIIVKYGKLLDSLQGSFVTNMKMARLTSLIKLQISKNYTWNLVSNSLTGDDGSNYTYSAPSFKAYVMVPNDESVAYAHDLICKVLEGEEVDAESVKTSFSPNKQSKNPVVSKVDDEKKNNDNSSTKEEDTGGSGLEVILKDDKVTFYEGETFNYSGYTVLYHGKKLDMDSGYEDSFEVSGKVFNDSNELISYVNNLSFGEYIIKYTIKYKGEVVHLSQYVSIKKSDEDVDNNDDSDKVNDEVNDVVDDKKEENSNENNDSRQEDKKEEN